MKFSLYSNSFNSIEKDKKLLTEHLVEKRSVEINNIPLKESSSTIVILDFDDIEQKYDEVILDKLHNKILVVISKSSKNAYRAFKVGAYFYFSKPCKLNRIAKSVNDMLSVSSGFRNEFSKFLYLSRGGKKYKVCIDEISYLKADGSYTQFFTSSGKFHSSKNLKFFQIYFKDQFIRSHRSFLINRNKIKFIDKDKSEVMLQDGKSVLLSKRKASFF